MINRNKHLGESHFVTVWDSWYPRKTGVCCPSNWDDTHSVRRKQVRRCHYTWTKRKVFEIVYVLLRLSPLCHTVSHTCARFLGLQFTSLGDIVSLCINPDSWVIFRPLNILWNLPMIWRHLFTLISLNVKFSHLRPITIMNHPLLIHGRHTLKGN